MVLDMAHGKALLMGATGTIQGRLGWAHETIVQLFNEYEPIITELNWLEGQEFDCIHYVMRFGAETLEKIEVRKINKHNELPVASQLSMAELHDVFLDRPKLRAFIEEELKRVLKHLKGQYGLQPVQELGL